MTPMVIILINGGEQQLRDVPAAILDGPVTGKGTPIVVIASSGRSSPYANLLPQWYSDTVIQWHMPRPHAVVLLSA